MAADTMGVNPSARTLDTARVGQKKQGGPEWYSDPPVLNGNRSVVRTFDGLLRRRHRGSEYATAGVERLLGGGQ